MSCRARDRPWEPRAWGGESPRPAWLHGPRVGSTGGGGAAPRETHSYWSASEGAGSRGYSGCEPHDLPAVCNESRWPR